jgi:hypothetical protein
VAQGESPEFKAKTLMGILKVYMRRTIILLFGYQHVINIFVITFQK